MNWITRLFAEINELIAVMATKLNTLNANKEDKANKKQNLSSTSADDYPSVPAVRLGLDNTLQAAQTYTDLKIGQNNANYIPLSQKGANNGVATLDATGKVPENQIPAVAIVDTFVVNSQAAMLALTIQKGDIAIRTDINKNFILQQEPASTLANWVDFKNPNSGVQSVAMAVPAGFQVTGSPITSNGTFTISYATGYRGYTTAEYNKLSNIEANANNYTLPVATATTLGGVELFSNTVQTQAANAVSAVVNKTYGVQLNAAGQLVVNVPWTDNNTTYTTDILNTLNTGTSTVGALQSAKNLNDWADGKYVKLSEMGDPTVGIPDWSAALQTQTPNI